MVDALIPGSEVVNGKQALQRMLPDATWLHGAVAFATQTGVDELTSVLEEVGAPETLRIVVRGAPITEPQAVLALDRDLEADVRVVMGAGFTRSCGSRERRARPGCCRARGTSPLEA